MRPGETAALQVVSAELPGGVGGCSEPHVCGGLECATGLRGSTLAEAHITYTAAPLRFLQMAHLLSQTPVKNSNNEKPPETHVPE